MASPADSFNQIDKRTGVRCGYQFVHSFSFSGRAPMRRIPILMLLVAVASPALLFAQGDPAITSAEPFKLGTFEIAGDQRIGIVLQDKLVVDLNAANRALERNPAYPR